MQEMNSPEITRLAKALLAVQRELASASKDATNPFTRSRYATLNSGMEACREALLTHGIWLTQLPVPAPPELGPGHIGLLTKLTHAESGQWQGSLTVVPLPKADPQGMGSAITYARRYALTAMLGMITEDDDGEGARAGTQTSTRREQPPRTATVPRPAQRSRTRTTRSQAGEKSGPPDATDPLPPLEGVAYQRVTAQDGRLCIVATGNTQPRREILSGAGFRWDARRGLWWKYDDAAPQLCRMQLGVRLPDDVEQVDREGWLFCLSMRDAMSFGPYALPAADGKAVLRRLRQEEALFRQHVLSCRAGGSLEAVPHVWGFHPLCAVCDHAADCPKFPPGDTQPQWEPLLVTPAELRTQRDSLETTIREAEAALRQAFRLSGTRDWIRAGTYRFREGRTAGQDVCNGKGCMPS